MNARKMLRYGAPLFFVTAAVMIGLHQSGSLRGQLFGDFPEMLTPSGEAVQIDPSRIASWAAPTALINVTWTPARTRGGHYALFFRDHETGDLIRKITVDPSALSDVQNPLYLLSTSGFAPYKKIRVSVAVEEEYMVPRESEPKVFWIGITNVPRYEDLKVMDVHFMGVVTSAEAILRWSPVDQYHRTISYFIELSESGNLDGVRIRTRSLANVNAPEVNLAELTPLKLNGEYQYRIIGEDMFGKKSQWSDVGSFTVEEGIDFASLVPEIIGPKGLVPPDATELSWTEVRGATEYRVTLWSIDEVSSFTYDEYIPVSSLENAESPSWRVPGIFEHTEEVYFVFQIQARNAQGDLSRVSEQAIFNIERHPFTRLMPETVSPSGVIPRSEDVPTVLQWNPVEGAAAYLIALVGGGTRRDSEVLVSDLTDAESPSAVFNVADWRGAYPHGLFTFTVRGRNPDGVLSQVSPPRSFSFGPSRFSQVVPSGLGSLQAATTQRVMLTWNRVDGAVTYEVETRDIATGIVALQFVNVAVLADPNAPKLERNFTAGRFAFRVRGWKDANTDSTKWSLPFNFTVNTPNMSTAVPVITGPLSGSNERFPITWNAKEGATHYDIWVIDYTNGLNTTILNTRIATQDLQNQSLPTFTKTNLFSRDGVYGIWVRAHQITTGATARTVSTPWSNPFIYAAVGTHGDRVSAKPVITQPQENAQVRTLVVRWLPLPGVVGSYQIFIRDLTNGKIIVVKAVPGSSTSYTMTTPLTPNHRYGVSVRGIGGAVFSPWSLLRTVRGQ